MSSCRFQSGMDAKITVAFNDPLELFDVLWSAQDQKVLCIKNLT